MQVTLDISHSTIEESEQRVEIATAAVVDTNSEAANALGESALSMFAGSAMEPGVASLLPEGEAEEPGHAGKGGKGKDKKGKGKGKGSARKKEPVQCLDFVGGRPPCSCLFHVCCMDAQDPRRSLQSWAHRAANAFHRLAGVQDVALAPGQHEAPNGAE